MHLEQKTCPHYGNIQGKFSVIKNSYLHTKHIQSFLLVIFIGQRSSLLFRFILRSIKFIIKFIFTYEDCQDNLLLIRDGCAIEGNPLICSHW